LKSPTLMKADSPMPTLPRSARRHLQRNLRRRRLGGVCAGIADYLGVDVTLVRFLFVLSIFFSASLTLWIYLALWFLLPASSDLPIPEVSWHLARELRRMEKRVRKMHRKHAPAAADLAQESFEAIKVLAPYFEQPGGSPLDESLREAVLVRYPKLLDKMIAMPSGCFAAETGRAAPTPANALLSQLADLRAQFQQAANDLIDREFRASYRQSAEEAPELAAWREQLHPLQERLKERSGPQTLGALQNIEEKLAFLLERIGEGNEFFDLRPFEVRKIAFEYLPDTLNQYLQLPPSMAQTQRLNSGKTAEESLNEQLNLLDSTLHDLAKSLFEKDAGGLLVHGRFLKEKFAEQPFRLPE
jgi:phage shock protein PspC (stress-responsive transcriptional regulator)